MALNRTARRWTLASLGVLAATLALGAPGRAEAQQKFKAKDCLDCHNRAELTDISGIWVHPTRPLAGHVACAVCHSAAPHGADAPPPPARWNKRTEEQCLACHRTVELALAQQYSHGFAPGLRWQHYTAFSIIDFRGRRSPTG